jgi:hypothetical protein
MRYILALLLVMNGSVLAATGSAINEPALAARSDIIHFEGFESTNWWQGTGWEGDLARSAGGWEYPNVTTNLSLVNSSAPVPGDKALAIEVDYGQHVGSVNPRVSLNSYDLDEAYIRYYVLLPTEMVYRDPNPAAPEYKDGGKLPGLARRGRGESQECCMGQDYTIPADGAIGWSARGYHWGHPDYPNRRYFSNYVYHLDDTGDPGSQLQASGTYNEGQWYCWEQRVKMNTPNQNDGILENWIDGVKVASRTNYKWRTVAANNIGEVWFGVYIGGANVASSTYNILFDNFVIARNRVGCYEGGAVLPALNTPAGISWNDGTLTWTQDGESNVANWTVRQCWGTRTCTESTEVSKSVAASTPWERSLVVSVRANPVNVTTHEASAWGTATIVRPTPEPVLGLAFAPSGITTTPIELDGNYNFDLSDGSADWKHWGTAINEKSGASIIGDLTLINAAEFLPGNQTTTTRPGLSWASGGTPTASNAETREVRRSSPLGVQGSGMALTVSSSASVLRKVSWWVRTQDATADVSISVSGSTQTVSIGDGVGFDYYRADAYILGGTTATLQLIQTSATGTSVAVLGAAVYEL